MITYRSTILAIVMLCKNWVGIFFAKLTNIRLEQVIFRDGTVFKLVNGQFGGADLSMLAEVWYHCLYTPIFFTIQSNDIVVDVGANNGYFTLYAALRASEGIVIAVEPVPVLVEVIRETSVANHCHNIFIEQKAIVGTADISQGILHLSGAHNGCHSLFQREVTSTSITVEICTLMELMYRYKLTKIDFLKLDCEGAEFDIILNAPQQLLAVIDKIAMEYHDDITEHRHGELVAFLRDNNFIVTSANGYIYALNRMFL